MMPAAGPLPSPGRRGVREAGRLQDSRGQLGPAASRGFVCFPNVSWRWRPVKHGLGILFQKSYFTIRSTKDWSAQTCPPSPSRCRDSAAPPLGQPGVPQPSAGRRRFGELRATVTAVLQPLCLPESDAPFVITSSRKPSPWELVWGPERCSSPAHAAAAPHVSGLRNLPSLCGQGWPPHATPQGFKAPHLLAGPVLLP